MIIHGDCLEKLGELADSSVDAIVTDPPYGLSFMGKKWDYDVPSVDVWRECLRVLKPGGHALIACGTRTQHRMAVNIEDAGFDIRDVITWLYGSGFPKSLDVSKALDKAAGAERVDLGPSAFANKGRSKTHNAMSGAMTDSSEERITAPATALAKQWSGWGTALKPACEFWTLARKPLDGTVAANVTKWGVGGINVDRCRVGLEGYGSGGGFKIGSGKGIAENASSIATNAKVMPPNPQGRFPANLILDEEAAAALDEQTGFLHGAGNKNLSHPKASPSFGIGDCGPRIPKIEGDTGGGASRFFYVAKASKAERNLGVERAGLIWETEVWQKPDLKLALEAMLQLAKDTSDDTLMDESSWSTDMYGHSISEQYPKGMTSTISTALKLITALKTWSASPNFSISASIQDAIKTMEASGLSLAESVAFTSQLSLNTTSEKTASLLGAVRALLPMLFTIRGFAKSGNFHSTVKPLKLMRYLCRLITPPNGTVLDPFMGSGSTGVAAKQEGFQFIGIEREAEYVAIAKARIAA